MREAIGFFAVVLASLFIATPSWGVTTAPWCVAPPAGASREGPRSADEFTRFFAGLGGPGWTGGDGSWSVRLDGKRVAWLFGDTYLGGTATGRRDATSKMVNNTMLVQSGWCARTVHGGTRSAPSALVGPATASQWRWPAQPLIEKGVLRVFYGRIVRTGPGSWDFAGVRTELATFDLATMRLMSVAALPTRSRVLYGAAAVVRGAYTYVYGVENLGWAKYLHVARAPAGRLDKPWRYRTRAGWSGRAADSVRLVGSVADQVTVLPAGSGTGVELISQIAPFSSEVRAFRAPAPDGPFAPGRLMATVPSMPSTWTYNTLAHSAFRRSADRQLLSYNVNGHAAFTDPSIHRPRFVDAAVPAP